MIYTKDAKKIRVMLTPFRDGLQSSFGGKVRLNDFLPAMVASVKEMGARHLEFGGGARYQAPFFYLGENPFETMKAIRDAVGAGIDLQILTRSISGVTLTTQSLAALDLQARLMKEGGTTWDRNFDYMNDVDNLVKTGKSIVDAGMHHQVSIAMMGLPFESDKVHTAEFYINIGRQLLESGIRIDSLCLKDASGTTDPKTIYGRGPQKDHAAGNAALAAHPRHRQHGRGLLHGRNRRRRGWNRPLHTPHGQRHGPARCPLHGPCPERHRLFP